MCWKVSDASRTIESTGALQRPEICRVWTEMVRNVVSDAKGMNDRES